MNKYRRQLRKYYNHKKRKERNNELHNQTLIRQQKTFFDKLYIRIFLSSLLLLFLLFSKNVLKLDQIKHLNEHINILPIVKLFTNMYTLNTHDIEVSLPSNYENIEYKEGVNYITNESFNGVSSASSGIVIKINKQNDIYSVTIKDDLGIEYTYSGLASIEVSLYSFVFINDIIGSVNQVNNKFSFTITITKNDEFYSVTNLYA